MHHTAPTEIVLRLLSGLYIPRMHRAHQLCSSLVQSYWWPVLTCQILMIGAFSVWVPWFQLPKSVIYLWLDASLLIDVQRVYPNGHRLWQDNDPKHSSRSTKEWFQEHQINHWPTPLESPVRSIVILTFGNKHSSWLVKKIDFMKISLIIISGSKKKM